MNNKKTIFWKKIKRVLEQIVITIIWAIWLILILLPLIWPYAILLWIFAPMIWLLIKIVCNQKLRHYGKDNIIVFGGKRKGKGLIFQHLINGVEKGLSNIPYGNNVTTVPLYDYFESIAPNTFEDMINGTIKKCKKVEAWEGVPYFLDDSALYLPSTEDSRLKAKYKSLPLFITAQGHLYDSYTVVNTQNIERLYKTIRELQMDGYIKAKETIGKGYISRHIPILRKYFIVKWRFYENIESAKNGLVPFSHLGITQRVTDPLYKTTASALKEQYEGQNGIITDGLLFIRRKDIYYDTRYYETVFFENINHEKVHMEKATRRKEKKRVNSKNGKENTTERITEEDKTA